MFILVRVCVCVWVSRLPEDFTATGTLYPACPWLLHLDDNGAVCTWTQLQLEVTLRRNKSSRKVQENHKQSQHKQMHWDHFTSLDKKGHTAEL